MSTLVEKGVVATIIGILTIIVVVSFLIVKFFFFTVGEVKEVGVKGVVDKVWNGSTKK